MCKMRRVNLHGREVFPCSFIRAVLLWVIVNVVIARPRRGSRSGPAHGNVDDEGFVDILAAGIVGVESWSNGLFWTQNAFCAHVLVALFPAEDLEDHVGGIDAPSEGVGIFLQNDIANIVDQIIFGDFDSGGRTTGPLHPYFSLHGASGFMSSTCSGGEGRHGRSGRTLDYELRTVRLGARRSCWAAVDRSNLGGIGVGDERRRRIQDC
jgi:hypothetical protein